MFQMASAQSVSKLHDLVTCGVCMEKYDHKKHIPKLLSCQHTFCLSCLKSISDAAFGAPIECPVCQCQHSAAINEFITNRIVLDITEELQNDAIPLNCTVHNKESVLVCVDCLVGLCVRCMKVIQKNPHSGHQLEELDGAEQILHQRFHARIKEKQAALKKNAPIYSAAEIRKAESDINEMHKKLNSLLASWRDEQLAHVEDLKIEITRQEQEILAQETQLQSQLEQDTDIGTLVIKLKEMNSSQSLNLHEFPPLPRFDFNERCQKLLGGIQSVITRQDFQTSQCFKQESVITRQDFQTSQCFKQESVTRITCQDFQTNQRFKQEHTSSDKSKVCAVSAREDTLVSNHLEFLGFFTTLTIHNI